VLHFLPPLKDMEFNPAKIDPAVCDLACLDQLFSGIPAIVKRGNFRQLVDYDLKPCVYAEADDLWITGSSLLAIHSGLTGHVYDYMYFLKNNRFS